MLREEDDILPYRSTTTTTTATPMTRTTASASTSTAPSSTSYLPEPEVEETGPLLPHSSQEDQDLLDVLPPAPGLEPPPYVDEPTLKRATVMQSRRYLQNASVSIAHRLIAPGTFAYRDHPDERVLPAEWLQFIHPEGKVYFYHPRLRIVTEAWIYNPTTLQKVVQWANDFFRLIQQHHVRLPQTSELCLELEEETNECSYYLIDHARRTEFWVEPTTTDLLDLPPVTSQTHLRLMLEHHYWTHVEYYPVHLQLSDDVENELQGILLHACADSMTSDLSTAPLSPEKCQAYLQLITNLQTSPVSRGYKNCIIARLWGEFARNRFINLHGEENARLCRDQMLSEDPESERSKLLGVANYLLFNVPESHLQCLKSLFVDDIAYTEHWQRFIRQLIQEWQESALGSMVLLITELVLFMSLSRLDGEDTTLLISIQHFLSLAAIILAAGSTLIGVVLVRHHKRLAETHAAEAVSTTNFLAEHQHPTLGMRPLATLYAVPYGFLTWSIMALVLALVLLSMELKSRVTQILIWGFCFGAGMITLFIYGLLGKPWRVRRVLGRVVRVTSSFSALASSTLLSASRTVSRSTTNITTASNPPV